MRLYFNGCSHTFGDDLVDQNNSWPSLVAKSLQCDFVNDAVSGGTNDRILYRTIKEAGDFDRIYIAWTYTSRFTRYRSDNNYEVNFNTSLTNKLYSSSPEFKEYGKMHYAFWHNELYSFKLWLQQIILLQRYLDSINKPYVMLNADNNFIDRWTVGRNNFNNSVQSLLCFDLMDNQQLLAEHQEIQKLISQINFTNYIDWGNWWITQLSSIYPIGPTRHLLEDGHVAIAKHILTHDQI